MGVVSLAAKRHISRGSGEKSSLVARVTNLGELFALFSAVFASLLSKRGLDLIGRAPTSKVRAVKHVATVA